ncbi:hypothetical protein GCM10027057_11860 [Marisediminicola antarctica]|uniref:Uncharacterized protein n=2 Tax=Marisediminicola antarctica TaxID=674079 RepID=A0A7L5AG58_9MICO|nr:hypothetical protein BHD05_04165 [Marisediminicola antarctica]
MGFLLVGAGAVAVFVSDNSTGTAALLASGVALIAVGVWGDRVETLEAGGIKAGLREAAVDVLAAAVRAESNGEPEIAAELRGQAERLLEEARASATEYEQIRSTMGRGWDRTALLGAVVERAKSLAGRSSITRDQVELLFNDGSDGNRITALAMIQADGRLARPGVLMESLSHPRSAFEQWNAIVAIDAAFSAGVVSTRDREELKTVLSTNLESNGFGLGDSDRRRTASALLERLS